MDWLREAPLWGKIAGGIGALVVVAALIAGPEEEGGSGSEEQPERAQPPFTDVRVRGTCPGFTAVGVPLVLKAQITNTGAEDWPRTYVTSDDFDDFVINAAALNHVAGRKEDSPSFDTWSYAGLDAGERAQLTVNLTPTEPGNKELQVSVWGGDANFDGLIPSETSLYGCEDVAIQP